MTARTSRSRALRALLPAAAAGTALLLALTGCGSSDDEAGAERPAGPTSSSPATAALSVTDPWVKAAPSGMTAAFGILTNDGPDDLTVIGATTDVAGSVELHETVVGEDGSMTMQEREDGYVVPAGGSHELVPGGDHLMMMGLGRALQPGEKVTLTLELGDGSTIEVDATVKPFSGAQEEYQGDHDGDHER